MGWTQSPVIPFNKKDENLDRHHRKPATENRQKILEPTAMKGKRKKREKKTSRRHNVLYFHLNSQPWLESKKEKKNTGEEEVDQSTAASLISSFLFSSSFSLWWALWGICSRWWMASGANIFELSLLNFCKVVN